MKPRQEPLITKDSGKVIKKELESLRGPVTVIVFTSEEVNRTFNEFCIKPLTELSAISDKILPKFETVGGDLSIRYAVTGSPVLLIQPDKYNIRLRGAPAGEELPTFLLTLLMASAGASILSDASKARLKDLNDKRNIKVFVSPTCPYCPLQAALAIAVAIERPGLVSTEIIGIYERARNYLAYR